MKNIYKMQNAEANLNGGTTRERQGYKDNTMYILYSQVTPISLFYPEIS